MGVKEQEGRVAEGGAEDELSVLLPEATWFGPGDGLLWLPWRWRVRGDAVVPSWLCCLSPERGCWDAGWL